jgi:hypothetical protein
VIRVESRRSRTEAERPVLDNVTFEIGPASWCSWSAFGRRQSTCAV